MTAVFITLLALLLGALAILVASALLLAEHSKITGSFTAAHQSAAYRDASPIRGDRSTAAHDSADTQPVAASSQIPREDAATPITQVATAPCEQELPAFTAPEMFDRLRAPYRTLVGSC